jgi:hypothetical protein
MSAKTVTKPPKKTSIEKKVFDNKSFKEKLGLVNSAKDKELTWIPLSKAFHDALKIPGFPRGYVSMVRGYSNTGKSTAFYEGIAGAQKIGDWPIIIETEGNFNWEHARNVGMQYTEIVDTETGEIIDYDGNFTVVKSEDLYDMFKTYDYKSSTNTSKVQRYEPVIEDVHRFMVQMLDLQAEGEFPYNIAFFWDSIGTLNGYQSATSKTTNNQWNAGAMNVFQPLTTSRIPSSRREHSPYINTFVCVQKIWLDNMNGSVIKHKCGEMMFFNSRLIVHLGGILTHGTTKLKATALGQDFQYGTEVKIRCEKNHVNGIERNGKIASTPHGYWNPDELDEYKKQHRQFIHNALNVDFNETIIYSTEDDQNSSIDSSES